MRDVKGLSLKLSGKIYSQNTQRMPLRMSKINQSNCFISDRLTCSRVHGWMIYNIQIKFEYLKRIMQSVRR